MKTRIIQSILALVLTFMALPMIGQDYLTISFKDGREERHLLSLVKEIATSKYNISGDLCSNYVTQIVSMADTVLKYPLEDIEEVSFKGVDEEEVLTNVESVSSCLKTIMDNCESVSDIKQFLNDIENNHGVEKILVYDNAVVIRIKDWRNIVFFNSPKTGGIITKSSFHRSLLLNNKRNNPQIYQSFRVAIADQNAKNENPAYVESTNVLKDIQKTFEDLGYDVEYIPQPDLKFFHQDIFDYDIVMLTTHGMFDGNTHWFATGEEIGDHGFFFGLSRETTLAWYRSQYDLEDADFCFINETRGGEKRWVLYTICSEDYIRKSPFSFNGKNSIVFTNVCESLNGNNSVAEMFVRKGASNYLGYKGSTFSGEYAGRQFFCDWMLNGTSVEFAYNHLDNNYLIESDYSGAELKIFPENNSSQFIVKTVTGSSSQVKDEPTNDGKHDITIYGYTTMTSDIGIIMGFEFSSYSNMQNVQTVYVLDEDKKIQINNENGNYRFQHTIQGTPGSTCYYRAFTYDGLHYNYGEIDSLTLPEEEVHEYVDLGLPSGTLWATCNIGASKPEEYGNYYAWGETETKESYTWDNYIHCDGTKETCHNIGADIAGTDYDVAHKLWGDCWTMPTKAQINELTKQCTKEWTTLNGVKGCKITGPNGNSIFLPAAGFAVYDYLPYKPDVYGMYMSSTMCEDDIAENWYLDADENNFVRAGVWKYYGFSVRPVISPEPVIVENADQPLDLGLPSGTLWAQCNLGASQPHELGNYYAWGETKPKEKYDMASYVLYNSRTDTYTDIGTNISGTKYDAAHVTLGGTWHMPTYAEFTELKDECEWKYTVMNGVNGYRVTGPNGKSIFLPCADSKENESAYPAAPSDTYGHYWSSMGMANDPGYAYSLNFNEKDVWWPHGYLSFIGFSIRPAMTK